MIAVGVDGWRDGWVAAALDVDDPAGRVVWRGYRQPPTGPRNAFARVLADHPGAVVGVDIPIGTVDGPRRSDRAAQDFLRSVGATAATVFPSPVTATVEAFAAGRTHAQAMADRPAGTPGTSIQAWNLIAKIVEVRDALAADGRCRVVEAHPECSFRTLDPAIGAAAKKTARGAGLRLRALAAALALPDLADAPEGVPVDDLLDAVAVAWTARRVATGRAAWLPADAADGEPTIAV